MTTSVDAVVRRFHRHKWEDTRINPYGTPTEQRCRCGTYRHHTAADLHGINMGDEPRWHVGRHPANVTLTVRLEARLARLQTIPVQCLVRHFLALRASLSFL